MFEFEMFESFKYSRDTKEIILTYSRESILSVEENDAADDEDCQVSLCLNNKPTAQLCCLVS